MFYLVHAATSLQSLDTAGAITTLTLPTGVTISSTLRSRFAVLARQVFVVNGPSINLWIDPFDLTVRPLAIRPPANAPTLAAGSGTGLTGNFRGQVAFYVKDSSGRVVNLSPISPLSAASGQISNKDLAWSNLPISPDASLYASATGTFVFGRRLYRTAAGGTDTFEAIDIDDNYTTTLLDTLPDAALSLLPSSPDLGNPPGSVPGTGLGLIVEWKNRLWAVSNKSDELDQVLFSDIDQFYSWPAANGLFARPVGGDAFGVTGFLPRRDYLGIGKRDRLLKVIGDNPDNLEVITVAEKVSCVAPETCVVIRDVGYFLGLDGVYRWDDDGVVNITRATVDPWFTTDTYFNRSRFANAFARWNPVANSYDVYLAAVGASNENRWISYHLDKGEWLGPHLTSALTPNCAGLLQAASSAFLPAIAGTDGYVYLLNQTTPSDVAGSAAVSAISASLQTRWHAEDDPDITHFWGRLSMFSRVESAGTLTITPYVGRINATAQATISHDLTSGRETLRRLGTGPLASLVFTQATAAKRFLLYGYEIDPVFEVGRR